MRFGNFVVVKHNGKIVCGKVGDQGIYLKQMGDANPIPFREVESLFEIEVHRPFPEHFKVDDFRKFVISTLTDADPAAQQPAAVDEAIDKKRFERAPCYLCGYNGRGYYNPDTHPCAEKYHAALQSVDVGALCAEVARWKSIAAARGEAEARVKRILDEALRELVEVFSESDMYDEEVFDKARAELAKGEQQ